MSVTDVNKIDGVAINKEGNKLMLLITDHLDWSNEYEHLLQLQDKVNAYVGYIENRQYNEIYPNNAFVSFCVEIHFLHQPTSNCMKFIDVISEQLKEHDIFVEAVTSK